MAKESFYAFLREQMASLPRKDDVDLTGRIIIATGANTGLAYEAVIALARLNPDRIILACRNQAAGDAAREKVLQLTSIKGTVECWHLDLMDMQSVVAFADKVKATLPRLDILLSSAGIATFENYRTSSAGYEALVQTNNISNSLLGYLLLPLLVQTASLPPPSSSGSPDFKPHLSIVSSDTHLGVKSFSGQDSEDPLQTLSKRENFTPNQYPITKAINILNAQSLLALLPTPDVITINTVNPGLCRTSLSRDASGLMWLVMTIMKTLIGRSTECGARNLVWAALSDTPQGAYVSGCRIAEASDLVISPEGEEIGQRIWKEMMRLWKKMDLI